MNTSGFDQADVTGTIGALWVFPIKSCAGISVTEARLLPTGLEWDRAWMVVDPDGQFITQREVAYMVLVQPRIDTAHGVLRVGFPGQPELSLPLAVPAEGPQRQARRGARGGSGRGSGSTGLSKPAVHAYPFFLKTM